jgi:hypothetical protein
MDGMITTSTMSQNWEKRKSIGDIQAFFLITISLLAWKKMCNERERIWGNKWLAWGGYKQVITRENNDKKKGEWGSWVGTN